MSFSGCFGKAEDEDGLGKGLEEDGWDVTIRHADGTSRSYHVSSSPYEADADGDRLDDEVESLERTDPNNADTDEDGLLDGEDVLLDRDSGRAKRWTEQRLVWIDQGSKRLFLGERGNGTASRGGDPRHQDSDNDGIIDGVEAGGYEVLVNGETRTVRTKVLAEDTDGDILWDGEERALGLDPTVRDTDDDGVVDGVDLDPWRDVHLELRFDSLQVTTKEPFYFRWTASGIAYDSILGDKGDPPATFDSGPRDLSDTGGNMRTRQHNTTMALSAVALDASNAPRALDLFSTTAGQPFATFRFHVRDGTARLGQDPPGTPWPEDGRFEGPDGSVVFRIVASGPAAT